VSVYLGYGETEGKSSRAPSTATVSAKRETGRGSRRAAEISLDVRACASVCRGGWCGGPRCGNKPSSTVDRVRVIECESA
jgi:hypothetical protein